MKNTQEEPTDHALNLVADANARLIAAAPEMLDLIQRLARTVVGHGCVPLEGNYKRPEDGFIGQARALLARIEGE